MQGPCCHPQEDQQHHFSKPGNSTALSKIKYIVTTDSASKIRYGVGQVRGLSCPQMSASDPQSLFPTRLGSANCKKSSTEYGMEMDSVSLPQLFKSIHSTLDDLRCLKEVYADPMFTVSFFWDGQCLYPWNVYKSLVVRGLNLSRPHPHSHSKVLSMIREGLPVYYRNANQTSCFVSCLFTVNQSFRRHKRSIRMRYMTDTDNYR